MQQAISSGMSGKWFLGIGLVVIIALLAMSSQLIEVLPSNQIMVIQSMRTGELQTYTEPGPYFQAFGQVSHYPRRAQYSFNKGCPNGDPNGYQPKTIQFNDGGKAQLCGAISWEMPMNHDAIVKLHKDFNSESAIDTALIDKAIDNAVLISGPTMSSTESSGERRAELLQIVDDQARNGVFETIVAQEKQTDPITKIEKIVNVTKIVKDEKTGIPKRRIGSAVAQYNIVLLPMSISGIVYSAEVEKQIATRQQATTAVQLSIADGIKADQATRTAEAQGRAAAATAKWAQETLNAKDLAIAEKDLRVATLASQAAEQNKRTNILDGEGEATKRRLIMEADGGLDKKVEAFKEINKVWAENVPKIQGNMVPQFVMGGSVGSQGNAVSSSQTFMDMVMMKTAKDLGIDMTTAGKEKTTKK